MVGKLAKLAGVWLVLGLAGHVRADDPATLAPADIDWINNGSERAKPTASRVLVRFDMGRGRNADRLARANLRLLSSTTQPESATIEVRPITADWGGISSAFRENEMAWTRANADGSLPTLLWQQRGRTGEPLHGSLGLAERWLVGNTNWTWAVYPAGRWKTPGGDCGEPVGQIRPADRAAALDVTALVKSWLANSKANFGLMLRLVDEASKTVLDLDGAFLELEGDGVDVDRTCRIDEHPDWLPRTYRLNHPRFAHPDADWLAKAKADPKALETLGKAERLVIRQRLNPTAEGAAALSDFIGRGRSFDCSYWADMYSLGVVYDWGWDLLEPEDRMCLLLRLKRLCGHTRPPGTPLNAPGNRGGAKVMWAALSIFPDMPGARRHVWHAKAHFIDTCMPLWRLALGDEGGFWHEQSIPYRVFATHTMNETLWGWPGPTGQDLFRENPWWESIICAPIYGTRPDGIHIRHGLMYPGEPPGGVGPAQTATQVYQNPYGPGKRDGITPTAKPWGPPLPKDFPTRTRDSLPLVRYTQGGLGLVFMRSDWSEDGTFIWFKCGLTGRAHNLLDAGHFGIYKRAPLAVYSGSYIGGNITAYTVYSHLAISKNTITVTDPDERPLKVSWMGNNVRDGLIPNDGGQRWTAGKFCSDTPWTIHQFEQTRNHCTGQIVAFQPGRHFTYVCGDVTEAYTGPLEGTADPRARSRRVRKFLRTLLYLPPDHLVVFDQVESFNKDFAKRWLLHTVNEPKVEGDLTAVEHTEMVFRNRYATNSWDRELKHAVRAGADHPFFREHPDCNWNSAYQPQLYQYDGAMFVRTLLPRNARIVKVGGPGREFWVNGQNYTDAFREVPSHEGIRKILPQVKPYLVTGEVGSWRLEVSPKVPAENDLFLHVIQVGARSQNPRPTEARLLPGNDGAGVEVDLGGGRKAAVVFKPGVGGHVKIEQAGQSVVDEDLAEKVLPNLPVPK